ncbi:HD-GYP domain-containing protein [Pseudomonas aeruginosa]|uniref:HD-GYP domain-containing protein n=1 Tax=Pseudomonas aeruginosa TaxID=287 RepID=UPI0031BAE113
MVKRIPVSELRLGMYIHKLACSWVRHPFWRGSFLLTEPQDLSAIRECGVGEVWVDLAKSQVDPESPESPEPRAQSPEPRAQSPEPRAQSPEPRELSEEQSLPSSPLSKKSDGATSMESEMCYARKLCLAAKSQVMDMFQEARLGKAVDPSTTLPLVGEIAASVLRQPHALISVARIKTHDDYTYLHSVAVCALMLSLARHLDLDEEQTRLAGIGGLMHDLGKAAMPLEVLNKPGKLTDAEFAIMKRHPVEGAKMLRAGGAEPGVVDIALHHHEKIDGTGYPDRLAGDAISLLARMGAICDVYDAVTSERAYKKPWDPSAAMRQMAKWEGHFDKCIFHAFVKAVGIYPVGSLVRLSSQRLAVVVEPGMESLLTPKVRVFFSLRSREPIPMQTIDLAATSCKDSITGPEDPTLWNFKNLDDLWME